MKKYCKFHVGYEESSIELVIFDQDEESITRLWYEYNVEYDNDMFIGTFIDYLEYNKIQYSNKIFDIAI